MTFIPHEPPRIGLTDTLLTYHSLTAPQFGALIEPDPFGPVNKIVTLMRDDRRVRSVLCHVPDDADVAVLRVSTPLVRLWDGGFRYLGTVGDCRDGWVITVDGHEVMYVPVLDTLPPPRPTPAWARWTLRRRIRAATTGLLREQLRADANWIAKRFGYHHQDDCYGE